MKIERRIWDFAPRRLEAPAVSRLHPEDEGERRSRQLQDLRAEHPWMGRTVEVMQLGSWVANAQSPGKVFGGMSGALSGVTAVASAAWGVNKLARGETALDRIEGVGHLALGLDAGISSWQKFGPTVPWATPLANGAGFLAAGCEMTLGGADLVRGVRDKDRPRQWAGIAQLVSGASLALSVAVPGAGGLAQAAAVLSMVTRQSILGIERDPQPPTKA